MTRIRVASVECVNNDVIIESASTPGSYKSPFNIDKCTMEHYDNMLHKDLTYFKKIKMPKTKDYVVGTYGYISADKHFITDLSIQEFDTLSGSNWLSNFVIDICLSSYALKTKSTNIHILTCTTVWQLIENKKEIGQKSKNISFKQNSMVILPWLVNNNHWIIAFIDFKTSECYIMDPMSPYETTSRMSKNNFKSLCETLKYGINYNNEKHFPLLKLIQCPLENAPKQKHSFNCGFFILYYAFTIMDKSNFSLEFNATNYRNVLKKYLLENSEDMTDICLYCSRHSNKHRPQSDEECVEWVSCTSCCRWVSISCIPIENRLNDYTNTDFNCLLCQK